MPIDLNIKKLLQKTYPKYANFENQQTWGELEIIIYSKMKMNTTEIYQNLGLELHQLKVVGIL